jgi:CubicO group peptidase (beta-lactamase class C family)
MTGRARELASACGDGEGSYTHSDCVILGLALQKITKLPLNVALRRMVLGPLGLRNAVASQTPAIPSPVLHAYRPERKSFLGIPPSTPFVEDSTFWNPTWTLARGAAETTDIADLTRTAISIGSGRLLTRHSYREQIDPQWRGFVGCGVVRALEASTVCEIGVMVGCALMARASRSA